jgi:putative tryptophan/tyrosine transport system substrate-binding protein
MRGACLRTIIFAWLVAVPLVVQAQPAAVKPIRIGYLSSAGSVFESFRDGLRELGYVEGRNVELEVRLAAGRLDLLPALAAELVNSRVDMIAAVSPPAIQAAKQATNRIPIIMAFSGVDPVKSGFVGSLARPGGNVTGVTMVAEELTAKRLALLKQMVPQAARIAVLVQVDHPAGPAQVKVALNAAKDLGVELDIIEVRDARDYDAAIAGAARRSTALLVLSNPTFFDDRERLAAMAAKHRLPASCEWRQMAQAGCLLAYGPDIADLYRRAATFVDRIAKGASPSELPVERPTRFDLSINRNTANALGIAVPHSLLVQADHTIQ